MKKLIYKPLFLIIVISIFASSCLDFEELRENPNNPTSVPPSLLFTSLTPGATSSFTDAYIYSQYHLWVATDAASAPSYRFGTGSFNYGNLRNIEKMEEEAEVANAPIYSIMANFLRAHYFVTMTRELGDVPLSEAMKGAENPTPKYDSQKSVYLQCLNWLDQANNELSSFIKANPGATLEGDAYYGGNLRNWQKMINAYTIRVLVSLGNKVDDTDLDVKGRFNRILNNPDQYPLFESLNDNAQLTYRNEDGFKQSYNPDAAVNRVSVVYCKTYIDMLKSYQDPRLFKVADPTDDALEANPGDELGVRADFDSYEGAEFSEIGTVNSSKKLDGDFSFPNEDRYWNFIGQPAIFIGFSEQELNIAEAAHRGWVSVPSKTHYENGVRASMKFYGIEDSTIDDYLGNNAPYVEGSAGLNRIYEQMYLAFAENTGWESFFMTRRTGVPEYSFSSENGVEQLPVRWSYPGSENDRNKENYRASLISQFGSEVDNRDQVIWILKD